MRFDELEVGQRFRFVEHSVVYKKSDEAQYHDSRGYHTKFYGLRDVELAEPRPEEIRLVLDTIDGVPIYWAVNECGDCTEMLPKDHALAYLRDGVPVTIAIGDPVNPHIHFESVTRPLHEV
jgi:hypothetical protein